MHTDDARYLQPSNVRPVNPELNCDDFNTPLRKNRMKEKRKKEEEEKQKKIIKKKRRRSKSRTKRRSSYGSNRWSRPGLCPVMQTRHELTAQ